MMFSIKTDPATHTQYLAAHVRGRALLINPFINKGTAFTARERDELNLHGLLPPTICTLEQQLDRVYDNFRSKTSDIEKYIFLTALQDRNEILFYHLLFAHLEEMVPIVYTPTVGAACQKFSHIYRRARGVYIHIGQQDQIPQILRNSEVHPSVIVVTDGERILGLGDQGVGGMGIPIGKLCLYTLCAGIDPHSTLAIMLDAGTDNAERLADPLYLGLRHARVRGPQYQEFIDKFVDAVKKLYPHVLLQWEDFAKANALHQLARFREQLCTFNDDIQGTAAVVLAGICGALRITGQDLADQRVLIAGAGAAAQGIAGLIVSALQEHGLSLQEARRRIWMCDSKGLVAQSRENLEDFKALYAREPAEFTTWQCRDRSNITLPETVLNARPTILLGTSGTPGVFDETVVRAMATVNPRPVIFPLSNPTSRAECAAADAIRWSDGRAIVATGSPSEPVDFNGRHYRIGQGNNAYIFPGMGLGITVAKVSRVTDPMFLDAAKALASKITDADLAQNAVYPEIARIRECSHAVACALIRRAVSQGFAPLTALRNLEQRVTSSMWLPNYLPIRYEPA